MAGALPEFWLGLILILVLYVKLGWAAAPQGRLDIGVNPRGRQGFLQDVIAAGNVYVAVGNNDEVGGKNNSDFSLGASLTGATVTVNGKPVIEGGALSQ